MEIVKIKWFPEIRRREGWIDRGQKIFGAENTVYDTIMVDRSHFNLSNNRLYNAKSEITHIIHFRWWWFVSVDSTLVKNTLPLGEGNGTPLQYSCLENPMDGGAWWAAVHGVARSWMRLSDFPFTFHFHVLEKEMATHSGVLAWRIPGTGKPGGLPSMGSHRVGHDWSDLAIAIAIWPHKTIFLNNVFENLW